MSNETMQAARIHDYGGPEQIVIEQVTRPEPKAGEMLVRLRAAGVNPANVDRAIEATRGEIHRIRDKAVGSQAASGAGQAYSS